MYIDDTSILYQNKDVTEMANFLNKEFANGREWFLDNKLSICFSEVKTKCILFSREKIMSKLNITE